MAALWQGSEAGQQGIWEFSGYSSINMYAPGKSVVPDQAGIELDEITLFVQAHASSMFNPFFEIEYIAQPVWKENNGWFDHQGIWDIERAYNEFLLTDRVRFRLGKMLAPLGEWNQIHADPLVETVTHPLTSNLGFAQFITGAEIIMDPASQWFPELSFYYQPDESFQPLPLRLKPNRYRNVLGLNLKYGDEFSGQIAFSLQSADLLNRDEKQLVYALDGSLALQGVHIMSQVFLTGVRGAQASRKRNTEKGGFLQLLFPLSDRWSAYGRVEQYFARDEIISHQNVVLGGNYRTENDLVWKLEYVQPEGALLGVRQGVYASFGVMF